MSFGIKLGRFRYIRERLTDVSIGEHFRIGPHTGLLVLRGRNYFVMLEGMRWR